jgi:hypothetical protein
MTTTRDSLKRVVRPERFELPTLWFEARCSIQLSYGRNVGLRNEFTKMGRGAQRQVVGLNGSCDRRRAGEGSPLFTESGSTKAG